METLTIKSLLEPLLKVGTKIKIGYNYSQEFGYNLNLKAGEIIELIEGTFEFDNGLYTVEETVPAIWDESSKDFKSIYHLFGNNLQRFMDCEIIEYEIPDWQSVAEKLAETSEEIYNYILQIPINDDHLEQLMVNLGTALNEYKKLRANNQN